MAQKKKKKIGSSSKRVPAKKGGGVTDEQWPLQRNLFFRPERMKYVRKLERESGCVFCRSGKNDMSFSTLCVFKSKHSQIVLNKYPYNNGHLLVLPLDHVGELLNLSPERYDDLHHTLRLAVKAIKDIYNPTGMNIGMNHGATGGAGIPEHIHYHVIPRWSGDLNFFPLIAQTKIVIETLEETYTKFAEYFQQGSK